MLERRSFPSCSTQGIITTSQSRSITSFGGLECTLRAGLSSVRCERAVERPRFVLRTSGSTAIDPAAVILEMLSPSCCPWKKELRSIPMTDRITHASLFWASGRSSRTTWSWRSTGNGGTSRSALQHGEIPSTPWTWRSASCPASSTWIVSGRPQEALPSAFPREGRFRRCQRPEYPRVGPSSPMEASRSVLPGLPSSRRELGMSLRQVSSGKVR